MHGLKVTAHRLAQRLNVQVIVEEERQRLAQGQQISNDRAVASLAGIADDRANPAAARVPHFARWQTSAAC